MTIRLTVVSALLIAGLAPVPSGAAPVPGTACGVFPADNVWRMDIRSLPIHPKSKVWKRATHAGSTLLHPDFGPPYYGMPFDVVDASHEDVSIDFTYESESDPGPYPFAARPRSREARTAMH